MAPLSWLEEMFLERTCVGRVQVRVSVSVCAQSRSLLPSPPKQVGQPGGLGPSLVTQSVLTPPHRCVGQPGRREHFLFTLRFSPRREVQETEAPLRQEESGQGLGACFMTREGGRELQFFRRYGSPEPRVSPSLHSPSGGRAYKMACKAHLIQVSLQAALGKSPRERL